VVTVVCSSTEPVVLLTMDNFVDETKEKDMLIQFYAPWAERTDGKTWEAVASLVHASGAGKVPAFPLPCGLLLSPRALVCTCACPCKSPCSYEADLKLISLFSW
jgi:hypothetical protein